MVFDNDKLKIKFDLKDKGKTLESKDIDEAIEFYNELISNEYYLNDYYPYRRLVMLYHKQKDFNNEIKTIKSFFKSKIYCNGHNYLWFRNKAKRLIKELSIDMELIEEYCDYFKKNSVNNKDIQNKPLPIADRLFLSKGSIKVKSIESYDKSHKQYEYEEIIRDLKFDKKYEEAIPILWKMIKEEGFNYYRNYQSLCQLYRQLKEYDKELDVIVKYYHNCKSPTKHSEEWFEKRLSSVNSFLNKSITVDEVKSGLGVSANSNYGFDNPNSKSRSKFSSKYKSKSKFSSKSKSNVMDKSGVSKSVGFKKESEIIKKQINTFSNYSKSNLESDSYSKNSNYFSTKSKWEYSNYSKIDKEVKNHFPFKNPREGQLETVTEIYNAMLKGYKYIILEAGTGTGKSAIAACLASLVNNAYIFTVTKQLQEQYTNDFKDFALVKGRSNFQCLNYKQDDINETCDMGSCVLEKSNCEFKVNQFNYLFQDNCCEYYLQKVLALNNNVVISNYDYMFPELNYVNDFSKRDLIIFDEAHNLESKIMNLLSLEFTRKELKEEAKVNLSKQVISKLKSGDYISWINFIEKITDKYNKVNKKYKKNPNKFSKESKIIDKRIGEFKRFKKYINQDPKNWIVDYDSKYQLLSFKPIKIDNYAKDLLFKYGEVCLFMSASILDYNQFAKWLGIDKEEIYPIRRKSPFDSSRNPIYLGRANMNYKNIKSNAPKTIPIIKEILNNHKNEKGIIHTVSYQCKDYLMNNLNDDRLIDHNNKNRLKVLNKFEKSKKPLVLVSPSMNEGVDLPGDKCRFQIIYKMPYPSISNKQVKARRDIERRWYDYQTAISLVQTYGRGMRSIDDYCTTYFIDSRLSQFIKKDSRKDKLIPDFLIDAIVVDEYF